MMLGNDFGILTECVTVPQKLPILEASSILTSALAVPSILMDCSLAGAQFPDSVSSSGAKPTCWATNKLIMQTSLPVSRQYDCY